MENTQQVIKNNKYNVPCKNCILLPKCITKMKTQSLRSIERCYHEVKEENKSKITVVSSDSIIDLKKSRFVISFSMYFKPFVRCKETTTQQFNPYLLETFYAHSFVFGCSVLLYKVHHQFIKIDGRLPDRKHKLLSMILEYYLKLIIDKDIEVADEY